MGNRFRPGGTSMGGGGGGLLRHDRPLETY